MNNCQYVNHSMYMCACKCVHFVLFTYLAFVDVSCCIVCIALACVSLVHFVGLFLLHCKPHWAHRTLGISAVEFVFLIIIKKIITQAQISSFRMVLFTHTGTLSILGTDE